MRYEFKLLILALFVMSFASPAYADWSSNNTFNATNPYLEASNGGSGYYRGVVATALNDTRLVRIEAESTVTLTNATVSNSTWACYATSVSGNVSQLDCPMIIGNAYYIMASSSNSFWFYYNASADPKYPVGNVDLNFTDSAQGTNVNSPTTGYPNIYMQLGIVVSQTWIPPVTNYIVDNTIVCFTIMPVCINSYDNSIIYGGGASGGAGASGGW